jgi:hypothetical protein
MKLFGYVKRLLLICLVAIPIASSNYPFKILEIKPRNGADIQARIEEKQENDVTTYIITVENLKKEPGRYYDVITMKTDSPIKPELQLSVYGQILEAKKLQ